jgi:hypothetical protein
MVSYWSNDQAFGEKVNAWSLIRQALNGLDFSESIQFGQVLT